MPASRSCLPIAIIRCVTALTEGEYEKLFKPPWLGRYHPQIVSQANSGTSPEETDVMPPKQISPVFQHFLWASQPGKRRRPATVTSNDSIVFSRVPPAPSEGITRYLWEIWYERIPVCSCECLKDDYDLDEPEWIDEPVECKSHTTMSACHC